MTSTTCAQALAAAQGLGLERLDAQLLLLHALGKPASARSWLLAHDTDALAPEASAAFDILSARRAAGEPLAYLVGSQEFFGLALQVDARVLVPRADTETLVDWALELLHAPDSLAALPAPKILDLGTGSGAIALAVAHSLREADQSADVVAVDASADADGLDDIRHIIEHAPQHLQPGGWLLLEHGYDQAEPVRQLLRQRGFMQVQGRLDLAGIARCSGGQWPAAPTPLD